MTWIGEIASAPNTLNYFTEELIVSVFKYTRPVFKYVRPEYVHICLSGTNERAS